MSLNGREPGYFYDQPAATLQNAASGTGNGATQVIDANTVEVMLKFTGAATPSLTCIIEVSEDGTNWIAAYAIDLANVALALVNSVAVGATVLRYRYVPHPGVVSLRARVSAVVTGNVTVTATERRRA